MLDPAWLREMLRKLLSRTGDALPALIEDCRARAGRSLVDSEHITGRHFDIFRVNVYLLFSRKERWQRTDEKKIPETVPARQKIIYS
jgi:hypothetical protein